MPHNPLRINTVSSFSHSSHDISLLWIWSSCCTLSHLMVMLLEQKFGNKRNSIFVLRHFHLLTLCRLSQSVTKSDRYPLCPLKCFLNSKKREKNGNRFQKFGFLTYPGIWQPWDHIPTWQPSAGVELQPAPFQAGNALSSFSLSPHYHLFRL